MLFLHKIMFSRMAMLHAEILGVDTESYFHVDIIEPGLRDLYYRMMDKMSVAVEGRPPMDRNLSKAPGTVCLVKTSGRRGGNFVRASIIEAVDNSEYLFCYLIDDCEETIVHYNEIFYTTEEIMKFPLFVVKCKLLGMDCFIGDQCLKRIYTEYIKTAWKMGCNRCTLEVLDNASLSPTVRMTTCEGKDLANDLQQLMVFSETLQYPGAGEPVKATIIHCDDQGIVWYRPFYENQAEGGLNEVIKRKLQSYLHNLTPKSAELFQDILSFKYWKQYYNDIGEVYIYVPPQRDRCYRVIIQQDNEWDVERLLTVLCIDYGYVMTVSEEDLRPAFLVDPVLSIIPPQCLPFKFAGAVCVNGIETKFNCRKFWKFLEKTKVSIVIKQFGKELWGAGDLANGKIPPIGDILISNPTPYSTPGHPGHSLGEIFRLTECGCPVHDGYSTFLQNILPARTTEADENYEPFNRTEVMYANQEFEGSLVNYTGTLQSGGGFVSDWRMESDSVNWVVMQFYANYRFNGFYGIPVQPWKL